MDKKEAFGLFIAKHREARGLSQTALAKAVGISRPYLTQIEGGKRLPSDEKFIALITALGTSMEAFMREFLTGEIPDDQLESLAVLVRSFDSLQEHLGPEAMAAVIEAQPTLDQMSASLATLGGLPAVPGPDGWVDLVPEDRRLVQRLVNRLLKDRARKEVRNGDTEA
jgi:transcriptional regulator with XRE-family HTH domain